MRAVLTSWLNTLSPEPLRLGKSRSFLPLAGDAGNQFSACRHELYNNASSIDPRLEGAMPTWWTKMNEFGH